MKGLVGGLAAAGALATALAVAIGPPEDPIGEPPATVEEPAPVGFELEAAPGLPRAPAQAAMAVESAPAKAPGQWARRAAASLAASVDPAVYRSASFETQARALASTMGPQESQALALLVADEDRAPAEVVAAAEILRHVHDSDAPVLPARGLASLRSAWEERANDPVLAAAAVRALGAFGDADDRAAMLAEVTERSSASITALACAGLSAARGDGAADDLVRGFEASADPRRAEVALCALTAIASADDRDLSDAARGRCAAALLRDLPLPREEGAATRNRSARLCAAVAALDRVPGAFPGTALERRAERVLESVDDLAPGP